MELLQYCPKPSIWCYPSKGPDPQCRYGFTSHRDNQWTPACVSLNQFIWSALTPGRISMAFPPKGPDPQRAGMGIHGIRITEGRLHVYRLPCWLDVHSRQLYRKDGSNNHGIHRIVIIKRTLTSRILTSLNMFCIDIRPTSYVTAHRKYQIHSEQVWVYIALG